MLLRKSLECKLTRSISPLCAKLTICIVILISSLAAVQFLLLINEKHSGKPSGKIVMEDGLYRNSSSYSREPSKWLPKIQDRLDVEDNHGISMATPRTMKRRNDDFRPNQAEAAKTLQSGGHSLAKSEGSKVTMTSVDSIPATIRLAENMASESVSRGTVVMAAAAASDNSARLTGKMARPLARQHNGQPANFRGEPEVSQSQQRRRQSNSDDDGDGYGDSDEVENGAQTQGVDGFGTIRIGKPAGMVATSRRATPTSGRSQTNRAAATNLARKRWKVERDDGDSRDESPVMGQSKIRKLPSTSGNANVEGTMMFTRIPESMDSLMSLGEQEDLDADMAGDENVDPSSLPLAPQHAASQASKGTKVLQRISLPIRGAQRRSATSGRTRMDVENDEDDSDFDLDERRGNHQASAVPIQGSDEDLSVAAGHSYSKKKHHGHGHDHGKYYMYAKVPKKKTWEFGYKRGNKKHWIERHEKGHKNKFKTKVKWYDKKSKGKGVHIWDYNHHDKKHHG